ncbi:MAG TPA: nodulation protein NfeD [Dehalococcoidia bacterium]|nr:nodulation protein NfeD [Dehalococcoidia bacterium]
MPPRLLPPLILCRFAQRRQLSLFSLITLAGLLLLACGGGSPPQAVHVSELRGGIGPVTANFIDRALDRAEDNDATLWVLQLDTPGGLVSATDEIVQRIEAATVPVAVYVSPLGARAASAGTFITLSAHIAAMAPSTQIGAAHPVAGGGSDIEGDLGDKITNDAAADIRGIANLRGRNANWAEQAVRESVSITASEAVELNVIDLVAPSLQSLLDQVDGLVVALGPEGPSRVVRTAGAPIVETDMNLFESVLDFVATPNIAFMLVSLGGLALFVEIISPGLIGPGVFGVIALILGFFALGALETSPAGIALLVLAFVLILVEVFVIPGFGFFGIGGIISLLVGGLILFSNEPNAPDISLWVLLSVVVFIAAVLLLLWVVILADRRKPRRDTSMEGRMLGKRGHAQTTLDPDGTAMVDSELWSARSMGATIPEGTQVEVVDVDGLCVLVEAVLEGSNEPIGRTLPQHGVPRT